MSSTRTPGRDLVALHLLFFISGALGLVYEMLWMRRFTTLFGATTLAATATLSGFFLGSALGSAAFGARSPRWTRPLLAFGLLEIGVGLGALLVRPALGLYQSLYPSLQASLSASPAAFAVVKLLLALIAVGLPTFCMGGTLPALGQAVASGRRLGVPVGGLYAVNVAGAAAGVLAAPFLLLPRLGVDRSEWCAVAGSVAVGVTACLMGRRAATPPAEPTVETASTSGNPGAAVLGLAALSGAGTLALQVLWTRMFALTHENSIHSFAIVLVVFLVGLALGAAGARAGLRRGLAPAALLAWAWSIAGFLVIVSPAVFHRLTDGLRPLTRDGWHPALGHLLALSAAALLPATIALGAVLPLLMQRIPPAGRSLGRLLAANTLGAIAGPLLATFVLAPRLGLWWTIAGVGALLAVIGAQTGMPRRRRVWVWTATALAVAFAPSGLRPVRVTAAEGERLVSVREGIYGTTAVIEDPNDRWITVNNSYVLGGTATAGEERWQAHLPLLLHPAPSRVAFVGLGTGISAGAALAHPVEHVVALEIVPEVIHAAREDFAEFNARLLEDPRVHVVADDGRHFLAASPQAFDVVVGDLLVPWRPAEAALYTREHFSSVYHALAAEGVFCQWLPLYQMSFEQLASITRAFVDVFPRATLWRGNFLPQEPTLALVGFRGETSLDVAAVDRRVTALASARAPVDVFLSHPAGFWLFALGPATADSPWLHDAPANRDAEPWVELRVGGGAGPLVGEPLLAFAERLAAVPLDGTPLPPLDTEHLAWRASGIALARASTEGPDAVLAQLRRLPPELQRSLEVEAAPSGSSRTQE